MTATRLAPAGWGTLKQVNTVRVDPNNGTKRPATALT